MEPFGIDGVGGGACNRGSMVEVVVKVVVRGVVRGWCGRW